MNLSDVTDRSVAAEYRCFTCEGSFTAMVSDPANPTAEDFQAVADASHAHTASHPDSLKVGMYRNGVGAGFR